VLVKRPQSISESIISPLKCLATPVALAGAAADGRHFNL